MTAMEELIRLVSPPTEPVDAHGDWSEVEATLGLGLPADFKTLIEQYGHGQFVDFITPLTPFGAHDLLVQHAQRLLDRERSFREKYPDECPYRSIRNPVGCWLPLVDLHGGSRLSESAPASTALTTV